MPHIVSFSGGVCSFWAAKRTVSRYGKENVILLFADTLIEDEDLYRFNKQAQDHLGVPITRIADGRTPWQVFRDEHLIGNTHADICSRILKRELIWSWIRGHFFAFGPDPAVVHLGMDFSEFSRLAEVQANNRDYLITAPMCEGELWDKCRMLEELKSIGIAPPRLYSFGFPHNNCGGFCVKAGISHFVHLHDVLPKVFATHEQEELFTQQWLRERGVSNWQYTILLDRRGGKTKPLLLRDLRLRIEAGEKFPRDEWGGCGCAVSYQAAA